MKDELIEIWEDPAKTIAEQLLNKKVEALSPALAELPLLSIVAAVYKTKRAWSDYMLARKVHQFYTAWEYLDKPTRRRIFERFQKKPRAFTEKLLYILAQQEDLQKCKLLGVLTTAYLQDSLKRADYLDLIETVAHLSIGDLRQLSTIVEHGLIFPERAITQRYATLFVVRGLIENAPRIPKEQRAGGSRFYRITKVGGQFVECVQLSIGRA
jgi:hypothetical protein